MSEELGPIITFGIILASIFPAGMAAKFWVDGHIVKIIKDGKEFRDIASLAFEPYLLKQK